MLTSGKFHPTFYADIAGWGSTSEGGAKAYRHVPIEIVPPGNVDMVSLLFFCTKLLFRSEYDHFLDQRRHQNIEES